MKLTMTYEQGDAILEKLREQREAGIKSVLERMPEEDRDQFTATLIYDFEVAPMSTNTEQLLRIGYEFDPEEEIDDESIADELEQLLTALARIGILVTQTNHLSDRELYEKLTTVTLLEPIRDIPPNPGMQEIVDFSVDAKDRDAVSDRDRIVRKGRKVTDA